MNEIYNSKLNSLNPSQRAAVDFEFANSSKSLLLLAGAGSGKTTVLSLKFVLEYLRGFSLNEMICITFTVKAAEEMRARILNYMSSTETKEGDLQVGTFHSLAWKIICSKVLGVYGYSLLGFEVKPNLDDFENPNHLAMDSLVPNALELMKLSPDFCGYWQSRCELLLVDEYQDVSPDQIQFCKILRGVESSIFAVGDDDQAIYHFRGASPRSIVDFESDFGDTKLIKLEVNYRSHQKILNRANSLFKNKELEFRKTLISGIESVDEKHKSSRFPNPQMRWFSSASDEVKYVLRELNRLKRDGVSANDIVILARTNRMLEYFSYVLKELGLGEDIEFNTIHGAKGLEWEAVFIVGLGEGLFPLIRESEVGQEEEKRLFYVAITRARNFLYVSGAKNRVWQGKRQVYRLGTLPKLAGFSKLSRMLDLLWR